MTREISGKKRLEVLVEYVRGTSYDTIVEVTGVSKGSVANIVEQCKQDALPGFGDLREELDELRDVAVRMRKQHLTVTQAALGLAFFQKLMELGVEPQRFEGWADMCQKLGSADYSQDKVVDAAVRLLRAEAEAGVSYEVLPGRLEQRAMELHQLESRIGELEARCATAEAEAKQEDAALAEKRQSADMEKRRLDEELSGHLARHRLTLEQVETLSRLIPAQLRKAGLGPQAVDTLLAQAKALGSLAAALSQVEEEKRRAEQALAQAAQARAKAQKEVARLASSVENLKRKAAGLVAEIARLDQDADELSLEIRARRGDIEMVKRWLAFMDDPQGLDTKELDGIATDFQDLALRRRGYYEIRDMLGAVTWKTRFPPTMPEPEVTEELRRRTTEILLRIVDRDYRRGTRAICKRCGWTTEATAVLVPKAGAQAPSSSAQHQGEQPVQRLVPLPSAYQLPGRRNASATTETEKGRP